jgi:hypothetical protein
MFSWDRGIIIHSVLIQILFAVHILEILTHVKEMIYFERGLKTKFVITKCYERTGQ